MCKSENARVLIAEDEFLVGEEMCLRLERNGYIVAGRAGDGIEAVEMTKLLRPDVVIMDIKMPLLDGIQATRRIQEICPTPVIMLTAYGVSQFLSKATAAGAIACLAKPVSGTELARAIDQAIAGEDSVPEPSLQQS